MSELLNTIKKEQLLARKNGDQVRAKLLTTVIGEASPAGNGTVSDKDVEKTIADFYKNLRKNRKIYIERNQSVDEVDAEIAVLLDFMPPQLTVDEIKDIATEFISKNDIKAVGPVMGYFSKEYKGKYFGEEVLEVVEDILSQ